MLKLHSVINCTSLMVYFTMVDNDSIVIYCRYSSMQSIYLHFMESCLVQLHTLTFSTLGTCEDLVTQTPVPSPHNCLGMDTFSQVSCTLRDCGGQSPGPIACVIASQSDYDTYSEGDYGSNPVLFTLGVRLFHGLDPRLPSPGCRLPTSKYPHVEVKAIGDCLWDRYQPRMTLRDYFYQDPHSPSMLGLRLVVLLSHLLTHCSLSLLICLTVWGCRFPPLFQYGNHANSVLQVNVH